MPENTGISHYARNSYLVTPSSNRFHPLKVKLSITLSAENNQFKINLLKFKILTDQNNNEIFIMCACFFWLGYLLSPVGLSIYLF